MKLCKSGFFVALDLFVGKSNSYLCVSYDWDQRNRALPHLTQNHHNIATIHQRACIEACAVCRMSQLQGERSGSAG